MTLDVIIRGGRVVDGTGNPWFRADVGICGDEICVVGDLARSDASFVIDADDNIVCPGFVDIHNHSDAGLLVAPKAENLVHQGITTAVVGNCGLSTAPAREGTKDLLHRYISAFIPVSEIDWHTLGDLLGRIESQGVSCNVASLIGHGAIRIAVMGFEGRAPTESELADMVALTEQAMEEGAYGLSSGLAYAPGLFAETDELVALARVVARYGGIYASHIRSEGEGYLDAIREAIEIGERAGIPTQVSHIETHYPNFGMSAEALAIIERARDRDIDVTCDIPPYLMGMTTITMILPDWIQKGGVEALIERLRDPEVRARIKAGEVAKSNPAAALAVDAKWDKLWVFSGDAHPEFVGLDLVEITGRWGRESPYDTVFDLLLDEGRQIMIVGEFHGEEDLRRVITHPYSMIESDEGAYTLATGRGQPHPRAYGTFPMIFRKYVRGETRNDFALEKGKKLLSLEKAVNKMTSLSAARIGLWDRGLIREGMKADLLVFDPERISDKATYDEPKQHAEGLDWVLVNGVPVVRDDEHTGALPGRVLRKRQVLGLAG